MGIFLAYQKTALKVSCENATSPYTPNPSDTSELVRKVHEKGCVFSVTYDLHNEIDRKMYTDQTGKFPFRSVRGMQYIMVLLEMDFNVILVEPMHNRTSGDMVKAYQTLLDRLKKGGSEPKMHILDNE